MAQGPQFSRAAVAHLPASSATLLALDVSNRSGNMRGLLCALHATWEVVFCALLLHNMHACCTMTWLVCFTSGGGLLLAGPCHRLPDAIGTAQTPRPLCTTAAQVRCCVPAADGVRGCLRSMGVETCCGCRCVCVVACIRPSACVSGVNTRWPSADHAWCWCSPTQSPHEIEIVPCCSCQSALLFA